MSDRASDRQSRLPGRWTLVRDVLSFFGGWALIFMEVSRPEIRESVLVLGGSIISAPGLGVAWEAIRARTGTGGSQSQPADSPSSSSS